jgi:hypothetical protein
MFRSFSQSWDFTVASLRILGSNKRLIVFPLASLLSTALVVASFAVPLVVGGQLAQWANAMHAHRGLPRDPMFYLLLFLFYYLNYFVITFFNSALFVCILQAMMGQRPSVRFGLSVASYRLPEIAAWALFAACVGMTLKIIESTHRRAGQVVAGLLGMAWTAMTYFVVPVIVLEGVGPLAAVKQSLATLRKTWGTALVHNFSLKLPLTLILLPIYACGIGLVLLGRHGGNPWIAGGAIAGGIALFALGIGIGNAAETTFNALLYNFANDRPLPDFVKQDALGQAFVMKP